MFTAAGRSRRSPNRRWSASGGRRSWWRTARWVHAPHPLGHMSIAETKRRTRTRFTTLDEHARDGHRSLDRTAVARSPVVRLGVKSIVHGDKKAFVHRPFPSKS